MQRSFLVVGRLRLADIFILCHVFCCVESVKMDLLAHELHDSSGVVSWIMLLSFSLVCVLAFELLESSLLPKTVAYDIGIPELLI